MADRDVETASHEPASGQRTPARRSPLDILHREIDRLFDDFLPGQPALGRDWEAMASLPAVDVSERDDAFEVSADLPGVDPEDIDLTIADDRLSISGETRATREEKDKSYYLSERRMGRFQRVLAVPPGVDTEKVAATYKDGVLTVTLPKSDEAQAQSKRIKINAR